MKRCPECMTPVEGMSVCPYCQNTSFDDAQKDTRALPVQTLVAERYTLGVALSFSRQAICYLAYDEAEQKKVLLEEFFPRAVVQRVGARMQTLPGNSLVSQGLEMFDRQDSEDPTVRVEDNNTAYLAHNLREDEDPEERADEILDNPVRFRKGGDPIMTVNCLVIPDIPVSRNVGEKPPAPKARAKAASAKKGNAKLIALIAAAAVLLVGIGVVVGSRLIHDGQDPNVPTVAARSTANPEPTQAPAPEPTEAPVPTDTPVTRADATEAPAEAPTEEPQPAENAPAPVTAVKVTVGNYTKTYLDADPFSAETVKLEPEDPKVRQALRFSAHGEEVGTYAIEASAALEGYDIEVVPGTLTIEKRKITIRPDNITCTYGDEDEPLTVKILDDKGRNLHYTAEARDPENPDVITMSDSGRGEIRVRLKRNAGRAVSQYLITMSLAEENPNYDITVYKGTCYYTIKPATLTLRAVNQQKTYGEDDPALTVAYSGFRNNESEETVRILYEIKREPNDSENVGDHKIIVAAREEQGNYRVLTQSGTLSILPAPVTVTADAQAKVYGEDDPALTWKAAGLQRDDGAGVLAVNISRAEGEDAGSYAITPTGEAAQGNYTVTYIGSALEIRPAAVTVTANAQTKVYGEDDPALTWEATGLRRGDGADVLTVGINRADGEDVGTYLIMPEGETAQGNYAVAYADGALEITPAAVTVTANAQTKVYGDTDPMLTWEADGLRRGDGASVLAVDISRAAGENVGSYAITPTGEAAQGNYTVAYAGSELAITPAAVTVTANAQTKVYGENDPMLTWKASGLRRGDGENMLTVGISRAAGENVGSYVITPTGETAQGNYTVTYADGALEITPALVTVTADAQAKVYGENDPALTWQADGLRRDDAAEVLTVGMNRAPGENVGSYAITPTGAAAQGNYTVAYAGSELAITPAAVTVTADAQKKVYGDAEPALTWQADGLRRNDQKDVLKVTIAREPGEAVGHYGITPTGEAAQGNYTVAYAGSALDITPAAVTVTADAQTKVYGDPDPALSAKVEGLKNGDAESVISYELSRAYGEDVGEHQIIVTAREDQGNYRVLTQPGTLTITPASVTVTADALTKKYGEKDPKLTWTVSGLRAADTAGVLTVGISRAEGEDVGTYVITPTGETAQGNYTVTFVESRLEITKKAMYVTAIDYTGSYDAQPHTGGALNAETLPEGTAFQYSVDDGVTWTNTAPAITDAGTVTYLVRATNPNYGDAEEKGTLTVTPRSVTVTVTGNKGEKVYNGEEQQVEGYKVSFSDKLYTEDDFKFNSTAVAQGTEADTYPMGLAAAQFENSNANFEPVFEVKDGVLTIAPKTVRLRLTDANKKIIAGDPQPEWEVRAENEQGVWESDLVEKTEDGNYRFIEVYVHPEQETDGETQSIYRKVTVSLREDAGETWLKNYEVIPAEGRLTVEPRQIRIRLEADTLDPIHYGDPLPEFKLSAVDQKDRAISQEALQKEGLTVVAALTLDGSDVTDAWPDAGEYDLTVRSDDTGFPYQVLNDGESVGRLVILPREVRVAVQPQQKYYGEPDPQIDLEKDLTITGLETIADNALREEAEKQIRRSMILIPAASDRGENAGSYPIKITKTDVANFRIQLEGANLEVLPRPVVLRLAEGVEALEVKSGEQLTVKPGQLVADDAEPDLKRPMKNLPLKEIELEPEMLTWHLPDSAETGKEYPVKPELTGKLTSRNYVLSLEHQSELPVRVVSGATVTPKLAPDKKTRVYDGKPFDKAALMEALLDWPEGYTVKEYHLFYIKDDTTELEWPLEDPLKVGKYRLVLDHVLDGDGSEVEVIPDPEEPLELTVTKRVVTLSLDRAALDALFEDGVTANVRIPERPAEKTQLPSGFQSVSGEKDQSSTAVSTAQDSKEEQKDEEPSQAENGEPAPAAVAVAAWEDPERLHACLRCDGALETDEAALLGLYTVTCEMDPDANEAKVSIQQREGLTKEDQALLSCYEVAGTDETVTVATGVLVIHAKLSVDSKGAITACEYRINPGSFSPGETLIVNRERFQVKVLVSIDGPTENFVSIYLLQQTGGLKIKAEGPLTNQKDEPVALVFKFSPNDKGNYYLRIMKKKENGELTGTMKPEKAEQATKFVIKYEAPASR